MVVKIMEKKINSENSHTAFISADIQLKEAPDRCGDRRAYKEKEKRV